jgi:hypothetical protein
MTHDIASRSEADQDAKSLEPLASHADGSGGFASLYAAVAGFLIGGFEGLSDRRAEAHAARLRRRAAQGQPRRLGARAKRGTLA